MFEFVPRKSYFVPFYVGFIIILRLSSFYYNVRIVFLICIQEINMAFLKTILIIVLVYYLFKMLAKLFAPKIINYAAKKTEAHFKEKFGDFAQQNPPKEEQVGDVIIDKKPSRKTNTSEKVGDYIDFEEID